MKSKVFNAAVTALLATTAMTSAVSAQTEGQLEDEQITSVFERYRSDYDSVGIRAGSFIFSPTIAAETQYNSNIFAQPANKVDDFVAVIKPSLSLISDWNNGALQLNAEADIARYFDNKTENYEDIRLNAFGRIDVSRGTQINVNVGYSDLHEDRGAPNTSGRQNAPTTYSVFDASVGFVRDEGLVSFAVSGDFQKFDFNDVGLVGGGTFNNDDRDHERKSATVRLGYDLNEDYEAFVRLTLLDVKYDNSTQDGGPNRNSDGWTLVGGASFNLGGKTEGQVYAGYLDRDYDSRALVDSSGFVFGASVLWTPTGLSSLRLGINRDISETTIGLGNVFSGGTLDTTLSLRAEHELQRNVLLAANASYTKQDYIGIRRDDDVFNIGGEAKYLMNRMFSLKASYNLENRNSNLTGLDYTRHVFLVGASATW